MPVDEVTRLEAAVREDLRVPLRAAADERVEAAHADLRVHALDRVVGEARERDVVRHRLLLAEEVDVLRRHPPRPPRLVPHEVGVDVLLVPLHVGRHVVHPVDAVRRAQVLLEVAHLLAAEIAVVRRPGRRRAELREDLQLRVAVARNLRVVVDPLPLLRLLREPVADLLARVVQAHPVHAARLERADAREVRVHVHAERRVGRVAPPRHGTRQARDDELLVRRQPRAVALRPCRDEHLPDRRVRERAAVERLALRAVQLARRAGPDLLLASVEVARRHAHPGVGRQPHRRHAHPRRLVQKLNARRGKLAALDRERDLAAAERRRTVPDVHAHLVEPEVPLPAREAQPQRLRGLVRTEHDAHLAPLRRRRQALPSADHPPDVAHHLRERRRVRLVAEAQRVRLADVPRLERLAAEFPRAARRHAQRGHAIRRPGVRVGRRRRVEVVGREIPARRQPEREARMTREIRHRQRRTRDRRGEVVLRRRLQRQAGKIDVARRRVEENPDGAAVGALQRKHVRLLVEGIGRDLRLRIHRPGCAGMAKPDLERGRSMRPRAHPQFHVAGRHDGDRAEAELSAHADGLRRDAHEAQAVLLPRLARDGAHAPARGVLGHRTRQHALERSHSPDVMRLHLAGAVDREQPLPRRHGDRRQAQGEKEQQPFFHS